VGNRGVRQMVNWNINAAAPGAGNPGRALAVKFGRTADTRQFTPFRTANYNALQTQVQRSFRNGFQFGSSYTFSKTMNYGDNSDSGLTFNWIGALDRNRAVAGFDRTHNFQLSFLAESPFGPNQRWGHSGFSRRALGGWQLNAIFSAYSGTPFQVTAAGTSLNAPGNTQLADQVLPEVRILGGAGRGESYFDPNAFAPVTAVRLGTSSRNSLRGPGLRNLDMSLFRTFTIMETIKLQFRAEAFNVSNTPAFDNPSGDLTRLTRNPDLSIRALNGFTEISTAQATERQFRIALRVSF